MQFSYSNLNQASNCISLGRNNVLFISIYNVICFSTRNFILWKVDIHFITIKIGIIGTEAIQEQISPGKKTLYMYMVNQIENSNLQLA